MKPGIRSIFILGALIALIAAGSSYWAGEQLSRAGQSADDARAATFKSYRIAQSLKALAAGYELTMNEFYSTVLKFPSYQKKAAAQQAAIDAELAALATLQAGDQAVAAELARRFKGMDGFRAELEQALVAGETDWDAAREALFKLNVLSVQAIQQADFLGQSASQRAATLDLDWQAQRGQAVLWQRIATGLALLAVALLGFSALRMKS
ncbi:MAG: hypothetical protein Q7J36_07750 [Thiobacillus sp.]|nr:hypothetical protein [Thiobacillus sp.]